MARHLAVLVYRLFTRGEAWVNRGAELFQRRRKELDPASLESKARANGFQLIPIAQAPSPPKGRSVSRHVPQQPRNPRNPTKKTTITGSPMGSSGEARLFCKGKTRLKAACP